MERVMFTSLLLTAAALRQYHFIDKAMNWTEAQSYCREKHTDLVSIRSLSDSQKVRDSVNTNTDLLWIGLRSTDTWVWSLSDPAFDTTNEPHYSNWAEAHDNDKKQPEGDGDCAFMKGQNRTWHDIKCSETSLYFICYNASSAGFVLIKENKNWTEAQQHCRDKHTDLASVRNQSENDLIRVKISQNLSVNEGVWIGLHRRWLWSDNSTSTFTNWNTSIPPISSSRDQICTKMDMKNQGVWTEELCATKHFFVCYDDELVLVRENKTWADALRHCRSNGMDLVSVTEQIQPRLRDVMANVSSVHVWLGLRYSCTLDLWFWVSGQTVCFQQWAPDYDRDLDDCVHTTISGALRVSDQKWISLPGTTRNYFICAKDE